MRRDTWAMFGLFGLGSLVCGACSPLRDLDAAALASGGDSGGTRASSGGEGSLSSGGVSAMGGSTGGVGAGGSTGAASSGGAASSAGTASASASGGQASGGTENTPTGGVVSVGEGGLSGGSAAGGLSGGNAAGGSTSGGTPSSGGALATGGTGATDSGGAGAMAGSSSGGAPAPAPAPDLPDDLPSSPVKGEITYSSDATWMVNDVAEPTFEIHSPTASYWVVKSLGSIVSITDGSKVDQRQWVAYSSGFRPLRGVPGFGSLPGISTVLDVESQTLGHVRLNCRSQSGDWQWVWDFYLTHVTLTVNRAPRAYAFSYRGVPGGALDDADKLVLSSGVVQSAKNSYSGELPGPSEWAYLADTTLGRSLFMIQHTDDDLSERFQVKDSDSALLSFGDGALVRTPQRFSLGLIDSATHSALESRVSFVTTAVR